MFKNIFMRFKIVLFILLFQTYSYSQDCKSYDEGIFEMVTGPIKFIVERHNNFQLEKNDEYGILYLETSKKIDDCEYIVSRYKVLQNKVLPQPDMTEKIQVTINKVEDEKFYFTAHMIGKDLKLEGIATKISNKISEDFEKILEIEK
jgi:hypothetical protein